MSDNLSRRGFLHLLGVYGGSTAVYRAAVGLGLLPVAAHAAKPEIAPLKTGAGKSVVVLGAGISGLVSAYELSRKGYRVQVLEASHRAGGRNLTVRSGDLIDETGNPQICNFDADPDLYFNCGPARLPGVHTAILAYCKELGVELAPFVNENRNAWVQDDAMFGGRPIRNREYITHTRGFIAELMAKSVNAGAFTSELTRSDCDRLLEYVKQLGSLDDGYRYASSTRAGHVRYDYMEPSVFNTPLALPELLRSRFMQIMSFGESDDQAAMMMEPVGGMDWIVTAFMAKVGPLVRTHAQVQGIHLTTDGVDVRYRHKGENRTLHADFCVNCIPIQLLAGIENNFPVEYSRPFTAITRGKLFKIGLQMKERFWENDGIYGGISWTMQDIAQVWYPAHGIHRKKGVVLGAYATTEEVGEKFARMSHAERIETAIAQGEKIHPGYGKYVEGAVSISWARMNHMCGCAVRWTPELQAQYFKTVQAPAGNHYLVGDQVSYHPGWQESAVHSAFHAIADIDRRVRAGAPQLVAS